MTELSTGAIPGIDPSDSERLFDVFAHHPKVKQVVLYGSRAKGNYRAGSDIDLSILDSDLSFDELLRIQTEIDELLMPYIVDLSRFERIENEALQEHIRRVGIVVYRRSEATS